MNLHNIVRGGITMVNPDTPATLLRSTGYTTGANGKQVPTYAAPLTDKIQVQALTGGELEHVNNLNIQGVLRAVYLYGAWNGLVRTDGKGGDLLQFPVAGITGTNWLVVTVLESWPNWSKVVACLQQ